MKTKTKIYIVIFLILTLSADIFYIKTYKSTPTATTQTQETINIPLNPEIINKEFTKVGKLIVSEGKITYKNQIADKKWYGSKSLDYEIVYKYGIGIDLTKLQVESIADNIVSIIIPVSGIKTEYLEIQPDETKIDSKANWFAKEYSPEIMKTIIQVSEKDVYSKVETDSQISKDSLKNLQENIESVVKGLGFKECYFRLEM